MDLRVLFVQQQPCIRALKYVSAFKESNHNIEVFFAYIGKSLSEFYGQGDELISKSFHLEGDIKSNLKTFVEDNPVDIIHCHNAPDTLTNICIDLFKGKIPIVHDIHDLMSARHTSYEDGMATHGTEADWKKEEQRAIEESDAVITVSEEIFNIAKNHGYKLPQHTLIYPNYLPQKYIPKDIPQKKLKVNGAKIVYEGFVSSDSDSHYYFIDIFKEISNQGFEVHIYPSRKNEDYTQLAKDYNLIHCYDSLQPKDLYKALTQYDYGWCGFNNAVNKQHLDTVLPNKFFEYISCGLPILTLPHKTLKKIVTDQNLGVVLPSVTQLKKQLQLADLELIQKNILSARQNYTVELNLPKVISLYNKIKILHYSKIYKVIE